MNEALAMRPIGVVRSAVTEQRDTDWGDVRSSIAVFPEFAAGLRGLEEFSHAVIVTYLHEAAFDPPKHVQRRPRGLSHMPLLGIFAQRAKDRPNPLGITAVRILAVDGSSLEVQGLDAIDGTPVLDVKPYVPEFDTRPDAAVPSWMYELMQGYFHSAAAGSTAETALAVVLEELRAREPIFHRPEHGTTRADFEAMTDPEFWEVGASGRRYGRDLVLSELEKRFAAGPPEDAWRADEFRLQRLADRTYLLTYTLFQGNRVTRRATIWRRAENGWKIVYHQGTVVDPSA